MSSRCHRAVCPRRQFLLAVSAAAVMGRGARAQSPQEVLLRPRGGNLYRVRMELEVEGNVNVARNPLVSRQADRKLPIKSTAVFDYEERYHWPPDVDVGSDVLAIERFYHQASSQSELNRTAQSCQLRASVRDTIVRRDSLPEVVYAVDDYFYRDELELLRVPACSAAVDQLLPTELVRPESRYRMTSDALGSLLNLSNVETCDVEGELVAITDSEARIQFRGNLEGTVEGVPTVVRTLGKLTFDRIAGTCNWLAMAVHETRQIGKAEPGFDVAATIKMIRKPLTETIALPARAVKLDLSEPVPSERLYVDVRSRQLGISAMMNRQWRMMRDLPGAAMMRMCENDRSIAQCDFRSLPRLEPGKQWTLEAFQADVKQTLGEQLSELIEADQRLSESGLRVLRVTAQGAVQGVSIQWVMLHFSDDSGRRVLATFTMEGQRVTTFAGSDVQLASSLRFLPEPSDDNELALSPAANSGSRSRVARAKSGEDLENQVQSASDLR